jgi:hypothetical protein
MQDKYTFKIKFAFLFILLIQFSTSSQDLFKDKKIDTAFIKYSERPRETAYVHLNKSTYIKNEDLGFTAYVFHKNDKRLSLLTKNLYVVIRDKNNKIVKEKLLKVENGIAHNVFKIDSLFGSGNYKFFAYTNWMKNFKEQNFFVQSFKVINPADTKIIKNKTISAKIDAQFLPESGHLVANIRNIIGVIIKNDLGFGVPNVSGTLLDDKNEAIASFKVNKLGIGKFSFMPESGKQYHVNINYNDNQSRFNINKIEQKGIVLSTLQKRESVLVSIKTNDLTFKDVANKNYKITLHNGTNITSFPVDFKHKIISKVFKNENLTTGINVFTLFDPLNNPIAERMIFNYKDIKISKLDAIKIKKSSDSLDISISYKTVNTTALNNVSISVLPQNTITYNQQQNIVSQTYLQPYIKGAVDNAPFYFKNTNNATKYHLDNLLLTQGWSSYSWNAIFNHSPNLNYFFEKGITLKANVKNTVKSKYVLFSINSKKPNYYILNHNEHEFLATNLFPLPKENIKISKIEKKGKLVPAKLYPQFFPNTIPALNQEYALFDNNKQPLETSINQEESIFKTSLNGIQQMDEIIIKTNLEERRIEKIKSKSFGRAVVLSNADRKEGSNLANFLNARGFNAFDNLSGSFSIKIRGANSINAGGSPVIYLDGMQLFDYSILSGFDMSIIDYIDINRNGIGEGIRGGAGVIKIYTDPDLGYTEKNNKTVQEFNFPLTFSESKNYYTPKYQNYNSKFYREYGVIDWLPINKINADGTISFKVANIQHNNIKLFIEGFANDGTFISETREIVMD